ncbi:MAG TPA: Gfo/Idh/MocA family oxidoreductase [Roseiflexaceae bacterium]|nr:Gfo/Idh/MocA family oxidoreductase [Roseiflexaceae bacterium]
MALRAIVIGAGWAGEGHTLALRDAGVAVVALCGRTPEPAIARARQLGVPEVRFDWRAALEEFRPDIVAIGTPGDTHRAMAEHAAALGCHVVCEKPLATNAADARAMLEVAERAGVKHAYAPTGRYAPAVLHAESLVGQGTIGPVREIEVIDRFNFPTDLPYCWVHDLARGGGLLNNGFTHHLAQVLRVSGGTVLAATGVAGPSHGRAPVGPAIHDFRDLFAPIPGWDAAQATEWREVDADMSCTVIIDLLMPEGHTARVVFLSSTYGNSPETGRLTCYGDAGALTFNPSWGELICELRLFRKDRAAWEDLTVPDPVMATLPPVEDGVQRCWNMLFREFAADVRGEGYAGYPTFRDGWVAAEIIDAARAGHGWVELLARARVV